MKREVKVVQRLILVAVGGDTEPVNLLDVDRKFWSDVCVLSYKLTPDARSE